MNPEIQPRWDTRRHTLIWNHALLLHGCDIPCSIHPPQPMLPLGEPGRQFDFDCHASGLTIRYNQQTVLKLGGGYGSHLQHPVQFQGRFQFYTLSHHFFWKWKNLKIRLKCYYHLSGHMLVIRLDLQSVPGIRPSDFKLKSGEENEPGASKESDRLNLECHSSVKSYPQRHFYPLIRIPSATELDMVNVEIVPGLSRGQMMLTIPVPIPDGNRVNEVPGKPVNFKQEDSLWVQHSQRSRLLYDQQMIFSGKTDILRHYLIGIYERSLYNTDYSRLEPLKFVHLREGTLSFSPPDPAWGHRCWFVQYYPNQLWITGEYLNRDIIKLLVVSKGMNLVRVELPSRNYRLIDVSTNQTLQAGLDNETLDLSFGDRHVFYIDRI
ncbi:MAG: hypothetical protein KBA26_12695 [Candidatus Delongbacteria bacterium]|nr:hypothetical protein [Candidatus Delongbacteria bacterium]